MLILGFISAIFMGKGDAGRELTLDSGLSIGFCSFERESLSEAFGETSMIPDFSFLCCPNCYLGEFYFEKPEKVVLVACYRLRRVP